MPERPEFETRPGEEPFKIPDKPEDYVARIPPPATPPAPPPKPFVVPKELKKFLLIVAVISFGVTFITPLFSGSPNFDGSVAGCTFFLAVLTFIAYLILPCG